MGRAHGLRVLIAAAAVSASGCSAGKATTATTARLTAVSNSASIDSGASSTTSAGAPSPAQVAISGFGGGKGVNADFVALEESVRADPDGLRAAALQHLGDTDELVHYAAVYALARTAKTDDESLQALRGLLASTGVDDRLLAAGALTYRGDSSGIPVLIDELGSTDAMAYWDPPQTASGFARQQLLRFTVGDFGLRATTDGATATAVKPAWQQWWKDYGATLTWDPTIEQFH